MKSAPKIILLYALVALFLSGCVTADYKAPRNLGLSDQQTSRIYDVDIDTVWRKIDTFSTGFMFNIKDLDKELGVLSAEFTGDPGRYVDGGMLVSTGTGSTQPYTTFMIQKNLQLSGTLDLTITEVGDNRTRMAVIAQYLVKLPGSSFENPFNGELVTKEATTWSFDSTGSDTQKVDGSKDGTGTLPRTFAATGALECAVLDELADYLQ